MSCHDHDKKHSLGYRPVTINSVQMAPIGTHVERDCGLDFKPAYPHHDHCHRPNLPPLCPPHDMHGHCDHITLGNLQARLAILERFGVQINEAVLKQNIIEIVREENQKFYDEYNNLYNTWNKQYADLLDLVNQANSNAQIAICTANKAESSICKVNTLVVSTQSDVASLKTDVSSIKTQNTITEQNINNLQTQQNTQSGEIIQNTSDVANLKTRVTALEVK